MRRRGHGVLELVLVVALTALVVALVWRVVHAATRADAQVDRIVTEAMGRTALFVRLARDLECAAPAALTGVDPVRPAGPELALVTISSEAERMQPRRVAWRFDAARGQLLRDGVPVGPAGITAAEFARDAAGTLELRLEAAALGGTCAIALPELHPADTGWLVHPSHRLAL